MHSSETGQVDPVILKVVDVIVMKFHTVDVAQVDAVMGVGEFAVRDFPEVVVGIIVDGILVAGSRDQQRVGIEPR